jgi:hypothetical protein
LTTLSILFNGHERTNTIVHGNDSRGRWTDRHQTTLHRVSSGRSTRHHARQFSQTAFPGQSEKGRNVFCRQNHDHFLNALALLERSERVKDDRSPCQLQKLFRPIARHPAASPGGGNNGSIH